MILQTLEDKKEWNIHFEKYIQDLDKQKPVIWAGDLNVAPTEMGTTVVVQEIIYSLKYVPFTSQIFATPRKTGTKHPDTLKQKHPPSKIYLPHPHHPRISSLSTYGASYIPRTDIIPTSRIDLIAGRRDWAGVWTCVSVR